MCASSLTLGGPAALRGAGASFFRLTFGLSCRCLSCCQRAVMAAGQSVAVASGPGVGAGGETCWPYSTLLSLTLSIACSKPLYKAGSQRGQDDAGPEKSGRSPGSGTLWPGDIVEPAASLRGSLTSCRVIGSGWDCRAKWRQSLESSMLDSYGSSPTSIRRGSSARTW